MSMTIMVVDDAATMRQIVGYALRQDGFDVVEAKDGQDALNKLDSQASVDMIITDMNMPNMDGITFVKKVRSHPKFKFVPVLTITTESNDGKMAEGRMAGVSAWIVKPFSPAGLLAVVKKILQ